MPRMRNMHPFYTLSSIRLRRHPAQSRLSERRSPVPLLLYVIKGSGHLHVGQQTWAIEADDFIFIPAEVMFHAEIGNRPIEYYQLLMRAALLSFSQSGCTAIASRTIAGLPDHTATIICGGKPWRNRLAEIGAVFSSSLASMDRSSAWDSQLLQIINDFTRSSERAQAEQPDGIRQTIDYMKKHYDTKITRDALARIAMLTPGAYCRSFKKSTGVTPTDYLQQVRIEKAKQHLAQGASLKEAAAAVSYKNEFHFSRSFKKVTGIPPTIYIKREILRVAIATRFNWRDNLRAMGYNPVVEVDCYRHPGMDEFEYERRVILRLGELRDAKPDLIIADFSHEPFYDTFKKIAPTVNIAHNFDWRHTHMQLAELIGREREAEASIQESEHAAAETGARLRQLTAEPRIAMLQIMPDHVILQGTVRHPLNDLLHRELQLQADPAVPRDHLRLQATARDIPELHADHVWIRKYSEHSEVHRVLGHLQARPFWQAMPAYQQGNIRFIANWLLMSWTPQGRQDIMAEVESYLAGKM